MKRAQSKRGLRMEDGGWKFAHRRSWFSSILNPLFSILVFPLRRSCFSSIRYPLSSILLFLPLVAAEPATSRPAEYFTDFHNVAPGKIPDDLMVLSGEFAVGENRGKRFLEIPGEPLDTFGVLFGPADFVSGDISAMVWGEASGKRFPEFGIGSNDTGGIKLWVFASQQRLELRRGDDVIASAPFVWHSTTWTYLRLRVSKTADNHFHIDGKSWNDGTPEPRTWMVGADVSDPLSAGRASLWALPFSGAPLRFTDLRVKPS